MNNKTVEQSIKEYLEELDELQTDGEVEEWFDFEDSISLLKSAYINIRELKEKIRELEEELLFYKQREINLLTELKRIEDGE